MADTATIVALHADGTAEDHHFPTQHHASIFIDSECSRRVTGYQPAYCVTGLSDKQLEIVKRGINR